MRFDSGFKGLKVKSKYRPNNYVKPMFEICLLMANNDVCINVHTYISFATIIVLCLCFLLPAEVPAPQRLHTGPTSFVTNGCRPGTQLPAAPGSRELRGR